MLGDADLATARMDEESAAADAAELFERKGENRFSRTSYSGQIIGGNAAKARLTCETSVCRANSYLEEKC